jgi:hypothetical protein
MPKEGMTLAGDDGKGTAPCDVTATATAITSSKVIAGPKTHHKYCRREVLSQCTGLLLRNTRMSQCPKVFSALISADW